MKETERDEYIDWLKGFAIILVVLGHCWLRSEGVCWLIYRFHMPLFFCISGYLFRNKKNFKCFFLSKCKTLLIPYILYFIISFFVCVTILNKNISISEMIKYLLLNGKYCSKVGNWAIWYLPLFFIASNVFYLLLKIKNNKIFNILILICGLLTVPINNYLQGLVEEAFIPFSIQVLPAAIFFMAIGNFIFKNKNKLEKLKKNNFIEAITSVILFAIGIAISINNNDQIINITTYRYIIAALLIMQFIIYITKENRNKAIIYIGRNSLIILGLHRIILKIMKKYKLGSFLKKYNITGDLSAILVTVLCIAIICLINETISNSIVKKTGYK